MTMRKMSTSPRWTVDDLPVGVWVGRAPDGEVAYANRAFREILGMEAVADSRTNDVPATYHACDRAGNPYPIERLPISRVLATGQQALVEDMVIHRADGKQVPIRAKGNPVRDSEGRISHVIVAFIDITHEAMVEADRAAIEARLKQAVDHAPIAVWEVDRDGIITLSEGAGLRKLGVHSGELVGQSLPERFRGLPEAVTNMRRALAGESVWYISDMGAVVYESWLSPVRNEEGEVVGARGVSCDITELRHLQAVALQDDRVRAMGALAASVAHEINNPLTYVLNYLDAAEQELQHVCALVAGLPGGGNRPALSAAAQRMDEILRPVRKGVERIATITRDLKAFSRPDETRLQPVDVGTVVQAVLNLMRKEIEARARLVLALQSTPPVLGNEPRLIQVVMNLLLNAVQSLAGADPGGDQIWVNLAPADGWAVLEVADSGSGVPEANRERVFEPFFTTKPAGQGTGLGLFVCRTIVQGLRGEISLHDRPGGGALFRVRLPMAGAARTPATASPATPRPERTGARVLIIDDDALVAESIANQIRGQGHEVVLKYDGVSALHAILCRDDLDLIYCDLMMPGMTGMDLAAALEERAPDRLARMVFMTGAAFTPAGAAFVAANPGRCVEKPFDAVEETRRRLGERSRATALPTSRR